MLETLHRILEPFGGIIHYSLIDYRGNAKKIFDEFLDTQAVAKIPNLLLDGKFYNIKRNKMNSEWVKAVLDDNVPPLTKRTMFLVATPENIDEYLKMSFIEIVNMFHNIDENFQNTLPDIEYLANTYGSQSEEVLLDYRSALWKWIDMFYDDIHFDKSLLFSDLHTSVMWR
jgi:hypothetical protein